MESLYGSYWYLRAVENDSTLKPRGGKTLGCSGPTQSGCTVYILQCTRTVYYTVHIYSIQFPIQSQDRKGQYSQAPEDLGPLPRCYLSEGAVGPQRAVLLGRSGGRERMSGILRTKPIHPLLLQLLLALIGYSDPCQIRLFGLGCLLWHYGGLTHHQTESDCS